MYLRTWSKIKMNFLTWRNVIMPFLICRSGSVFRFANIIHLLYRKCWRLRESKTYFSAKLNLADSSIWKFSDFNRQTILMQHCGENTYKLGRSKVCKLFAIETKEFCNIDENPPKQKSCNKSTYFLRKSWQ